MANIYTSSYTGEQVDAAVAGVNNLISGSTPAAKATADANGNNIATTYATQTGTYSGMTVGNATNATNASQLGGVDAESYAQLSQVVRTDTAQTLSDAAKKQACKNIGLDYISSVTGNLSTVGWHTICKMNESKQNGKSGVIYIKKMYSESSPSSFILTYNQTGYEKPVLTVQALTNTSGYKFRLFSDSTANEVYIQIYNPENYVNGWYLSGMAARNLELELVVDNTVDNRDTSSLQWASEVEAISNGINTTGTVLQQGLPVMSFDPTNMFSLNTGWPGWEMGSLDTDLSAFEAGYWQVSDGQGHVAYFASEGNGGFSPQWVVGIFAFVYVNNNNVYIDAYRWRATSAPYLKGRRFVVYTSSGNATISFSEISSATLYFRKVM